MHKIKTLQFFLTIYFHALNFLVLGTPLHPHPLRGICTKDQNQRQRHVYT